MFKTRYFKIEELVHPQLIRDMGEVNCWRRLDEGCLRELDLIRELWDDEIYINWGNADSRGLRPPDDSDGAFYSVHKQGKAFDIVPGNGDVVRLWNFIYSLIESGTLSCFNTIESLVHTPSWVHIASMNTSEKPLVINP